MDTVLLQFASDGVPREAMTCGDAAASAGKSSLTSVALAFAATARARPDHPAAVTPQGAFSYRTIFRAAESVARYLRARPGHVAGMRVALQLANSPEYIAAFYGTLLADGVAIPLPVSLEPIRREKILEMCRPGVLISRAEDIADPSAMVMPLIDAGGEFTPLRQGDDLAMLLFTSGSTSMPKGVMLSHRNLLANAASILRELPIRADDRALALLPFCHAFGNSILQTHMLAGATLLFGGALTFPTSIVDALHNMEATSFSAIPEVYGMLLKYGRLGERPLPWLRYMTVAGGEMRPELAAQVAERIAPAAFHVMYGQSEATARLACLPPSEREARRGSIGRPIYGVELAVMDEAGNQLPPDTSGTLCARGDNVMLGYFEDPAATAEVLRDGWLRTGDLAHRDREGYFYLHGRANLLVKIRGHRVHPAEIEGVVEAGFPHARAVALPMVQGEETRFALFLAPQGDHPIDVAKVRAACVRELPPYKVPVHFEVLDRLPLTSSYKVDRVALGLRVPAPGRNASEV